MTDSSSERTQFRRRPPAAAAAALRNTTAAEAAAAAPPQGEVMSSSSSNTKTSLRRLIQRNPSQSRSPSTTTTTTTTTKCEWTSGVRGCCSLHMRREGDGKVEDGWEERGGGRGRGLGGEGWRQASSMSFADVRSSHPFHTRTYFFLRRPLFVTHSLIGICHSGPTLPFEVLIAFLIKL